MMEPTGFALKLSERASNVTNQLVVYGLQKNREAI
jgi:hypothetical protein